MFNNSFGIKFYQNPSNSTDIRVRSVENLLLRNHPLAQYFGARVISIIGDGEATSLVQSLNDVNIILQYRKSCKLVLNLIVDTNNDHSICRLFAPIGPNTETIRIERRYGTPIDTSCVVALNSIQAPSNNHENDGVITHGMAFGRLCKHYACGNNGIIPTGKISDRASYGEC